MDFPGSSVTKNLPAIQETQETQVWSIPGLGRYPGGGHGNPPQYSCLENMLSKLVIIIFPRSKGLLISWLQLPSAVILQPPKIASHCFHCFPIYLPWSDGVGCHDLSFLNVKFKANFFTLLLTFIKRLFSSSSLSAIRVVSFAYLKLLVFLPAILIPPCASSSPAFCMMCSACKLNNQGDNIQPWHTSFLIWNQSVIP